MRSQSARDFGQIQECGPARRSHANQPNVAAAAPHTPGFQTVILPGSPGCALYPSAHVPARLARKGLPVHARDKQCGWGKQLVCVHRALPPIMRCRQPMSGRSYCTRGIILITLELLSSSGRSHRVPAGGGDEVILEGGERAGPETRTRRALRQRGAQPQHAWQYKRVLEYLSRYGIR